MRVPSNPAQWLNRSPLTARLYEPLWRHRSLAILTGGSYDTQRELETMVAWLEPRPEQRWLDAACSSGLYARTLAAASSRDGASARVDAVDHSEAFVRDARRRADAAGVAVDVHRADVHDLPFADAAFDGVACGGSLNEFVDPAGALAEFGRVVREGGRLWLMYAARAEAWPGRLLQLAMRPGGLRFPSPEQVGGWAEAAGFRAVRAERRGPVVLALYERRASTAPALE